MGSIAQYKILIAKPCYRAKSLPVSASAQHSKTSAKIVRYKLHIRKIASRLLLLFLAIALIYLTIGLGFHFAWNSALEACREARMARGEFVEPQVFGGIVGMVFDMTSWPFYVRANIYHWGTPFATPCDH